MKDKHEILVEGPDPSFIPTDILMPALQWIKEHPTAWLPESRLKYLSIRFDSRTGNGMISAKWVEEDESLRTYYTIRPEKVQYLREWYAQWLVKQVEQLKLGAQR